MGLILSCLASPPAPLKCHSFCIFIHVLHLEKKKGMIKKLPVNAGNENPICTLDLSFCMIEQQN